MSSPLRQQMIDEMTLRHFSPKTHQAYLEAVRVLARYYRRSPAELNQQQVQQYLLYLINERKLAWSTVNVAFSAFRFLYGQVLKWPEVKFSIPPRRGQQRRPEVLSVAEVGRVLEACHSPKHRVLLMTIYGAGLRVSEAVRLQPQHIDSGRGLIRIEQGKGNKDRYTILPDRLLKELRHYWRLYRPQRWLFCGRDPQRPLPIGTAQKIYYDAKRRAGLTKGQGIHTLRHCFATHLLERGYDIFLLKRMLGHTALSTTARYLHLCPERLRQVRSPLDLLDEADRQQTSR